MIPISVSMRSFYISAATLSALAAVTAPQAASAQVDDQNRIATVHIWTDSSERTYEVDLRRHMITKQWSAPTGSGEKAGWAKANIDARARQRPAYERLTEEVKARSDSNVDVGLTKCWIPCDHVPVRSWALFKARDVLRELIRTLKAELALGKVA